MTKQQINQAMKLVYARPIAYKTIHKKLCGNSIHGGLLLSQLIWNITERFGKTKINISNWELREQLDFSEREFRTAKEALMNCKCITISHEGIPPKSHYEIDWEKYLIDVAKLENNHELEIIIQNSTTVERIENLNEAEFTKHIKKEFRGKDLCTWNNKTIAISTQGKLYEKGKGKIQRSLKTKEAEEVIKKLHEISKEQILQQLRANPIHKEM